uniref:(northern house mosquito) hypothetical protein n=1 Tax=Culex pipiens TaxID=7175 RepID=A0A8D8HT32_CULPI
MTFLKKQVLFGSESYKHQRPTTYLSTNTYEEVNLKQEAKPKIDQIISIELRIPDRDMAKQIMKRTILLLESTAKNTSSEDERRQALQCVAAIKRDNSFL